MARTGGVFQRAARRSGVTFGRIETESGNNGDGMEEDWPEQVTVAVKRRWAWRWKRRDAERQLLEERWAWKKRALDAERQVARERREREAIERVKVTEVLREKTDLYERIEALEAELEKYRRNPG